MRRYRRVERRVHRLHAETRRESRLCRRRGTNPAERKPFEKQKSRRKRLFERKGYYDFRRKRQKDFLTIDVSFISLKLVLPACFNLLKDDGQAVVLVKPQFEVGKKLGKSGIVVNPVDRMKVVNDILNFARELGFSAEGITTVPDNFKNKNVEYLLYFKKTAFVSRPVKSVDLSFIKNL